MIIVTFIPRIDQEDFPDRAFGPYEWVQLTYGMLRVSPDGEVLAFIKEGDWYIAGEWADDVMYSDIAIVQSSIQDGEDKVMKVRRITIRPPQWVFEYTEKDAEYLETSLDSEKILENALDEFYANYLHFVPEMHGLKISDHIELGEGA